MRQLKICSEHVLGLLISSVSFFLLSYSAWSACTRPSPKSISPFHSPFFDSWRAGLMSVTSTLIQYLPLGLLCFNVSRAVFYKIKMEIQLMAETSDGWTNKTEHFFMNNFHIEGLHKELHSVFIYLFIHIIIYCRSEWNSGSDGTNLFDSQFPLSWNPNYLWY